MTAMEYPNTNISISVDLTNPGQFFACCGLLELADGTAYEIHAAPGPLPAAAGRGAEGGFGALAQASRLHQDDRDAILDCLKKQGGLDKCSLAFYREGALGEDEWDNWRLEGPSFVWYFRGTPHVHIWINVADDPTLPLNAQQF